MIVTRFQYPLEKHLLPKLDLMIKRCTSTRKKQDNVLIIEGPEGIGKTTFSVAVAYYVSEQTGRKFDHTHVFFDAEKMIHYIQNTDEEIIIWDEPALHALGKDAMTLIVKSIERLLQMSRKKRHFLIINMTYFNRFNDYIVWQRPMGMIHLYEDKNLVNRFCYIRKVFLEKLWRDWRVKKIRNYFKYASKYIRGTFPDVLSPDYKNNVLKEFNYAEYDRMKDEAIKSISTMSKPKKKDWNQTKRNMIVDSYLKMKKKYPDMEKSEITELLGISTRSINVYLQEIRDEADSMARIKLLREAGVENDEDNDGKEG